MGKITIEDISRHTGYSRGTVSRALNDRPDISQQTKERVLAACQQLNYVPSHAARSLATGRRYAVVALVDDLCCGYASGFVRGVVRYARAERYAVHISELNIEPEQTLMHLQTLVNERVDAVLLAHPPPAAWQRRLEQIINERPCVSAAPVGGLACDILAPDQVEAGRLAARHLLAGRPENLAYVHETGSEYANQRLAGFRAACAEAGQDPLIFEVPPHTGNGDRLGAIRDRLSTVRAIAASNDFLALELMLACTQMGRLPGRDIAVLGQGDELVGRRVTPTLSTVDFCGEEIGRRGLEIALQRIAKQRQDGPQHTLVPPVLVPRQTTRCMQL